MQGVNDRFESNLEGRLLLLAERGPESGRRGHLGGLPPPLDGLAVLVQLLGHLLVDFVSVFVRACMRCLQALSACLRQRATISP